MLAHIKQKSLISIPRFSTYPETPEFFVQKSFLFLVYISLSCVRWSPLSIQIGLWLALRTVRISLGNVVDFSWEEVSKFLPTDSSLTSFSGIRVQFRWSTWAIFFVLLLLSSKKDWEIGLIVMILLRGVGWHFGKPRIGAIQYEVVLPDFEECLWRFDRREEEMDRCLMLRSGITRHLEEFGFNNNWQFSL